MHFIWHLENTSEYGGVLRLGLEQTEVAELTWRDPCPYKPSPYTAAPAHPQLTTEVESRSEL